MIFTKKTKDFYMDTTPIIPIEKSTEKNTTKSGTPSNQSEPQTLTDKVKQKLLTRIFSEYPSYLNLLSTHINTYGGRMWDQFPQTKIFEQLKYTSHIEIRESKNKGLGVFAIKEIPVNSIITLYPCDIYREQKLDSLVYFNRSGKICIETVIKLLDTHALSDNAGEYIFAGYSDEKSLLKLGHMINDYSTLKLTGNLFKDLMRYIVESKINANVLFGYTEPYKIPVIISRKIIKPGDELLVQYGPEYWAKLLYPKIFPDDNTFAEKLIQFILSLGKVINLDNLLKKFILPRPIVNIRLQNISQK